MTGEYKHFSAVKHLDNLEVLKAMFFKHAFGRHYHEGYAIGVILKGSETYQCNRKVNIAPKGSVVVVNPGEIHNGHASDSSKGWGYFMIYPKLTLIQKALTQLELTPNRLPFFPQSVIFDKIIENRLHHFMMACESGDSKLSLESHFLSLLRVLIEHHADFDVPSLTNGYDTTKIKQVTDKIHASYDQNLSLETLANEVGLSAFALLRLFKKQTGISPYLFQTGLRIKKAKQDISSGASFAQTAVNCGFTDQSHMIHQFKRWMGITPGDYARANNTEIPDHR